MKTFEEKWTAWLDDQLRGKELADFEASLPDKAAAEAEKREAQKLGATPQTRTRRPRWATKNSSIINCANESQQKTRRRSTERESGDQFLVDDCPSGLVRCDIARLVSRLRIFRDAQPGTGGAIAISYTNLEYAGGSGVSPYATVSMFRSERRPGHGPVD